jgi:phosphate-induced protein 1
LRRRHAGRAAGIVQDGISSSSYPLEASALYVVLTSPDVDVAQFCTQMMGGHDHMTVDGTVTQFAFVGDPRYCGTALPAVSPNGDPAADFMANVLAHELVETITDPESDAWYDADGEEVGDKCAWTYAWTYQTSNGATADVHVGQTDYLLQQEWVNDGAGYCGMYWP